MFVNVPKRYDFENITEEESIELIKIKVEKEANRYIQNWPDEHLSLQNGRWGPFIKFKKKNFKIPKVKDKKLEAEDLKDTTIETVKAWIEEQAPGTIKVPKKKAAKKPAAKKKTTKKK
jgi:DNA topoisomerase-1